MDPCQRIFIQEAWKALEDAGYSDTNLYGKYCGVFVGCQETDYLKGYNGELSPFASTLKIINCPACAFLVTNGASIFNSYWFGHNSILSNIL